MAPRRVAGRRGRRVPHHGAECGGKSARAAIAVRGRDALDRLVAGDRLQRIVEPDTLAPGREGVAELALEQPRERARVGAIGAGEREFVEEARHAPVERAVPVATPLVRERAGVRLGVVLQHRFRPAAGALARWLREGALGDIAAASVCVPWWRPQSYYDEPGRGTLERDGGGVLLTQAIHTLDLFLSLTPPLSAVAAFATTTPLHRMETEDLACAALRFRNGALGTLDATTASYAGYAEQISIVGTRGTARLTAGKVDAVMVTNGDALVTGANGAKNVMVLVTDYSNGNDMVVAKPGIKSLKDLKGKKSPSKSASSTTCSSSTA